MSLLRPERRQAFPEPPIPPFPGINLFGGGTNLDMTRAMQSSTVWACVRLIASTVSMMPLNAYTMRSGVRMPIDNPPLINAPAASTTMSDWVYQVMVSLLLRGNAYGQIVRRDPQGYPLQIELLSPDRVAVSRNSSGQLEYRVNGKLIDNTRDVYHVRAYRMPGLDVGLSPIANAALTINRDRAIQMFALGYFQDAPHPAQVLTSDQPIDATQARTIKERLMAAVTGREPLVLGAGLKLNPLSISPNESQFLETQKYGAAEICRFFNVPASKIPAADVGSSMTYTSVEAEGIDFLTYTIQWWLTNLENSLFPMLPGQKHVRFDPSVLLRTDLETTMKATAIGIASKQMTPDEARAMRDQPPLTDDQKAVLALVPLDISPTGMPKALPTAAAGQSVSTEPDPEGAS